LPPPPLRLANKRGRLKATADPALLPACSALGPHDCHRLSSSHHGTPSCRVLHALRWRQRPQTAARAHAPNPRLPRRCGHCKSLAPEYDSAAETLKEHGVKIAKMDATAQTQTPSKCAANRCLPASAPLPPCAHPPTLAQATVGCLQTPLCGSTRLRADSGARARRGYCCGAPSGLT
jgi:hypothetical protein